MSGKKDITLYGSNGKLLHTRYRYKLIESALRRAIKLSLDRTKVVQIWHLSEGRELAIITQHYSEIRINLSRRRA